jgi:hypothetical protein
LIKLNSKGEPVGEIDFYLGEESFFSTYDIVPINESSFYTLSRSRLEGNALARLNISLIDTSLAIQWSKNYILNKGDLGKIRAFIKDNGHLIIGASPCDASSFPNFNLLFMEVDAEGDSIRAKYNYQGNPNITSIHSFLQFGSNYKGFVSGFDAYIQMNGFTEIIEMDSTFSFKIIKPVPYILDYYLSAKRIDSLTYMIAGEYYSSNSKDDIGIAKLTNDEDSLAFNQAGQPGKLIDKPAGFDCISISNPNSVYTGGTSNDNGLFYSCFSNRKQFMLSNYDSVLNCRWTRFYGNDTACYIMTAIEATSDGGCIMTGAYFTPTLEDNQLDALVLKVDSTGIITGTNPGIIAHDVCIYPNPGNGKINIQSGNQVSGTLLKLYDLSGKQQLEITLNSSLESADTGMLPSGTYIWTLLRSGKKIDSGKWVKD